MEEAFILGPVLIRKSWVIIALGFILGFILLALYPVHQRHKTVQEILFNGLVYFLLVWQLSKIFFRFDVIVREPLALFFYPSGIKEFFLASGVFMIYLWWKGTREKIGFVPLLAGLIAIGAPAIFLYFFIYDSFGEAIGAEWLSWLPLSAHPLHLYQLAISGLLIVAIITNQHRQNPARFVRWTLIGWSGLQWGITWVDPAPSWFGMGISPHLYGAIFSVGVLWQLGVLIKEKKVI